MRHFTTAILVVALLAFSEGALAQINLDPEGEKKVEQETPGPGQMRNMPEMRRIPEMPRMRTIGDPAQKAPAPSTTIPATVNPNPGPSTTTQGSGY